MADIDLSFGSDLGPLLDNFQRLLKASGELGNEVKKTATTMQVESRKSALEVVKIEQAYKETSQVVAQINSLGLNQFTNSIQLQVQATEQSVQANEELQKSADELLAKLLGQGATMAQQASQIEIELNKGAQACGHGFHVGTMNYASQFGGSNRHLMACKVNPKDVVSVPYDHSCEKCRV